jgi:hypothetical protein
MLAMQQRTHLSARRNIFNPKDEDQAIPVTRREGPCGCETSRLPHLLNNRLADGLEVVSLTHQACRPPLNPRKIPGTHFCSRLNLPLGHSLAGRIRTNENSNDLTGNRILDLPACSIVPQQTTLPRPPPTEYLKCNSVEF